MNVEKKGGNMPCHTKVLKPGVYEVKSKKRKKKKIKPTKKGGVKEYKAGYKGRKIRSKGKGRGLGIGRGRGPVGRMK